MLITLYGVFNGKDAIEGFFKDFLLEKMPNMRPVESTSNRLLVSGNTLLIRWSAENVEHISLREAAKKAAFALRELIPDIGFPEGLEEFGCREEDAPRLAEKAFKIQRLLVGNPAMLRLKIWNKFFLKLFEVHCNYLLVGVFLNK